MALFPRLSSFAEALAFFRDHQATLMQFFALKGSWDDAETPSEKMQVVGDGLQLLAGMTDTDLDNQALELLLPILQHDTVANWIFGLAAQSENQEVLAMSQPPQVLAIELGGRLKNINWPAVLEMAVMIARLFGK